MLLERRAQFCQ